MSAPVELVRPSKRQLLGEAEIIHIWRRLPLPDVVALNCVLRGLERNLPPLMIEARPKLLRNPGSWLLM